MPSVQSQIESLRKQINHHNDLYYQQAKPEISDREFDALLKQLIDLEAKHPEFFDPDSPTQRVGGKAIESFRTVEHAERMMSIDNTYSEAEVREFDKRMRKNLPGEDVAYVLEPKIDGIACNLRYENGKLVLAATRGDGRRGDDITHNALEIRSVPQKLKGGAPRILECRGEVYMPDSSFQDMNKRELDAGREPFANPRNATAGTLKQLDPKATRDRKLKFLAHGLGETEPLWGGVDTYWEWLNLLKTLGIPVSPDTVRVTTVDDALKEIEKFGARRGQLGFQTDGMVMKVDSLPQRETLGATSKAPKWVIAFKYPAEQVQTKLLGVRWQVGKNGTLTPVADLEPVFVSGSTVRRATLHNIDQITRLGVHLGDTIVLEKAGEVIPYVVSVVEKKRPKDAPPILPPKRCPSCNSLVTREAGGPFVRCENPDCPDQLKERLRYFVGRNQMDIEGMGTELVYQLVDTGKVKAFADLYKLTEDDIASLDREVTTTDKDSGEQVTRTQKVGGVIAKKVLTGITASKDRGLTRVLAGIGIPHFGHTASRKAAEKFGDIPSLMKASIAEIHEAIYDNAADRAGTTETAISEELPKVIKAISNTTDLFTTKSTSTADLLQAAAEESPPLKKKLTESRRETLEEAFPTPADLRGATPESILEALTAPVVASSLKSFLNSKPGQHTLASLEKAGVRLTEAKPLRVTTGAGGEGPLAGLSIVVTGTLSRFGRKEIETLITRLGGKTSGSVSKKTAFVLAGESAGSKLDKAKDLNIEILDEPAFIQRVGEEAIQAANEGK